MITATFFAQSCSRGVAPTAGNFNFVDGNPDDPQIMNSLCEQQGDTDSNNLICDSEEESVSASADANGDDIIDGNEKSWFARAGWWQMLGLAAMGVGTYFLVRDNKKNGKYWLKEPSQEDVVAGQDALGAGVYLNPRNNNGSVSYLAGTGSSARFFSSDNTRHYVQKTISKVDADLVYHTGSMSIKHGGKMLNCIHGAQLGVQDVGNNRLHVSMYFKEDYIKESTRMPKHVTQAQFFNYCDQNTGVYSATQTVEGADNFFVIAANPGVYAFESPQGTIPVGYKSGLTTALKFEAALPGDNTANNLTTIRYYAHHPAHPDDEQFASVDYQVNGISDINWNVTSTQLDFTGQSGNESKFLLMAQSNVKATAEVNLDAINNAVALSTNP
ncbi:MAG: hypothetical protein R2877_06255 [Bdellovibrionota bacterium]